MSGAKRFRATINLVASPATASPRFRRTGRLMLFCQSPANPGPEMSNVDTRQLSRDSLFVMAKVRVEEDTSGAEHQVKVRNLSSGGMMAEGA